MLWKYDLEIQKVFNVLPEMNQDLQNTDFTCAAYTPKLPAPFNCELVLLGTADGAVTAVNPNPPDMMKPDKL